MTPVASLRPAAQVTQGAVSYDIDTITQLYLGSDVGMLWLGDVLMLYKKDLRLIL
jgi:hypothetical protein